MTAGSGGERTVSVTFAGIDTDTDASATVSVDCTAPGHAPVTAAASFTAVYADACDSPLGTLADGVITATGAITADSGCTSAQRRTPLGSSVYYARRHSFALANPATVIIDIGHLGSASPRVDTYLLLLEGRSADGSGTVVGRDDYGGPRRDSRLADQALAPGEYTIEATTYGTRRTGSYDLRVDAQLGVLITGLEDAEGVGGTRLLAVELASLGSTEVTVTCTADGYGSATATSALAALVPVSDVAVDVTAGGSCTEFGGTLDAGIDQKYTCTMTRGDQMTLTAEATGPSSQMAFGWTAGVGVGATHETGDLDASVVGNAVVFSRTGTATVTCTAGGDITVTVSIGGTVEHTTTVSVTCQPPVQITDYEPGVRDGAGAMTGTFTVSPTSADCSAARAGGIGGDPVPGGAGANRTVSVTTTATGWLDVEVECENTGYGTATATGRFVARDNQACVSPLGVLRHGTRTFTGSLSSTSCTSRQRLAGTQTTFYAHRYTFTLATSGWVSVDLEPTDTGTAALDTYLVLLDGHGSGGRVLHQDDDSGTDNNARLNDLFLIAGDYTIEATTATNGATGGYRLTIEGDFAVQSDDLPATITATVGQTTSVRFAHQPAAATITVQAVTPTGLEAVVSSADGLATLDLTPDKARTTTVTLAFTASGHISTDTVTVTSHCQTGWRPSPDGTCQPLTPTLDQDCLATLAEGRTWGKRRGATILLRSLFGGTCNSVSVPGKTAAFQAFDVPATVTSRASYDVTVELEVTREALLFSGTDTVSHRPRLPQLSVVLWQISGTDNAATIVPMARDSSNDRSRARFTAPVMPGSYVAEIIPQYATRADALRDITIGDRFAVNVMLPAIEQNLGDVYYLGNIQVNDAGATLDAFLDARGTLRYGASRVSPTEDDDLFDPESPTYPWLSFSVDRCSIPEGVVALADAVVDRTLAALLMDWSAVYSGDIEGSDLDEAIQAEWFRDFPDFGGAEVAFVYACMRHDFNWRNLDRVAWFHNHGPDVITSTSDLAVESNARMHSDLLTLCNANRNPNVAPSAYFGWEITQTEHLQNCERTALFIQLALDRVPVWWRPYDWGPYDSR